MSASAATPRSEAARRPPGAAAAWRDGWWSRASTRPSPNFNPRPADEVVSLVVLHSISLPPGRYAGDAVERFFTNSLDFDAHPYYRSIRDLRVSSHFLIRRRGEVLQFVSCDDRAWHAGASSWRGRDNCNDYSVGIELEGLEGRRFAAPQYDALVTLLRALSRRYPIAEVVGHQHVAPTRKHDPGRGFDWTRLAQRLRWRRDRLPFASASNGAPRTRISRR